jgi:light-regulated signal transduction histidine kinase (bacteriophytochrome)
MSSFLTFIESRPHWQILTICLLITASIGALDLVTGDLSLLVFYIVPVFLAVWTLDRTYGMFVMFLCGVELCISDSFLASSDISHISIRTWNSIMGTLFIVLAGYLLGSFKKELERSRKRADQLEAANLELDAFNFSIAHDLRKLLANINGYSQLILELYSGKMDRNCQDYMGEIYDGAVRMNKLIDALIDFSRIAQSEPCMETFDLSDMAKRVADGLQQAEPDRKVRVEIADGITSTGDPQLLRVVLANLFGNAWKNTAKKAAAVISFGMELSGKEPVYYVRDNGIGFDGSHADKLFVPSQRLHCVEEYTGFGIGLATVERIVQRHGGRAWAEGERNKGATFYFTLGVPSPTG